MEGKGKTLETTDDPEASGLMNTDERLKAKPPTVDWSTRQIAPRGKCCEMPPKQATALPKQPAAAKGTRVRAARVRQIQGWVAAGARRATSSRRAEARRKAAASDSDSWRRRAASPRSSDSLTPGMISAA